MIRSVRPFPPAVPASRSGPAGVVGTDLRVLFSALARVDPQIVVGLHVDRVGFPLEIGCFEVNRAEIVAMVPIVKQFQTRHGLADMVVVANAGMLSAPRPERWTRQACLIVGSRMTMAPADLALHFR